MDAPDSSQPVQAPAIAGNATLISADDAGPEQPIVARADPAGALPRSTDILKVSTRSRPSAVAGAIAGVMRQHSSVEVQSIGAGATNQAIKAIAIARSYLRDDHIDVGCVPFFIDVAIEGEDRTALRLLIERYDADAAVSGQERSRVGGAAER